MTTNKARAGRAARNALPSIPPTLRPPSERAAALGAGPAPVSFGAGAPLGGFAVGLPVAPPVADPAGGTFDQVALHGLRVRGYHGVFDDEKREGQLFGCDLVLHLDTRAAAAGDDLARTVHYGEVADDVVAVLTAGSLDLIETLAEKVADAVLARPAVRAVDVVVHKPHAPVGHPVDDVTVAVRRLGPLLAPPTGPDRTPRAAHAVLGLGANLGDAAGALRGALAALRAAEGVTVTGVSPVARTAPVLEPGQERQPDYLNAVLTVRTRLAPLELLALVQRIEVDHGRERVEHWGARTLDIDLVDHDGLRVDDAVLTLPHPRAAEREFVLRPWSWLDPDARLAGHDATVAQLADGAAGAVADGAEGGPAVERADVELT